MSLRQARWWTTWLLGSVVGFAVGTMLVFILGFFVVDAFTDAEAALEGQAAFTVMLTLAFASGGALLGTMQWLHLRGRPGAGRWVVVMAVGFALIAFTYNLLVIAFGEAHLETVAGRAANEASHTVAVGTFVAWWSWVWIGRPAGGRMEPWVLLVGAMLPATGFAVWGLEAASGATPGDIAPLGMVVGAILTGLAWRGLMAPADTGASQPKAQPA